ncbi:MAG: hypothetical protein AAFR83_10380 [Cyanobacteria bacterium J06629_18]
MTPEQALIWVDEVDELGSSLFAGREVTREEFLQLGDYYLSGRYLIRHLEIIRKEKQKAIEGLSNLEAAEQRILKRMKKHNIAPDSK